MKVASSLKSLKKRDLNSKLVKFIRKKYKGDLTGSLINSINWEKKINKGSNF